MDTELISKWTAALRGGNYRQTKGRLRSSRDGYCCLGVLCDIENPGGWKKEKSTWKHEGQNQMPFGLLDRIGLLESFARELAEKNDKRVNFKEIADYIDGCLRD